MSGLSKHGLLSYRSCAASIEVGAATKRVVDKAKGSWRFLARMPRSANYSGFGAWVKAALAERQFLAPIEWMHRGDHARLSEADDDRNETGMGSGFRRTAGGQSGARSVRQCHELQSATLRALCFDMIGTASAMAHFASTGSAGSGTAMIGSSVAGSCKTRFAPASAASAIAAWPSAVGWMAPP